MPDTNPEQLAEFTVRPPACALVSARALDLSMGGSDDGDPEDAAGLTRPQRLAIAKVDNMGVR
ncbi:MAG: hypothetical protein RQ966_12935 [Acetobacteraceae bacterium]|nr:hypothetical protein [Acetobacteraceae bacterium]